MTQQIPRPDGQRSPAAPSRRRRVLIIVVTIVALLVAGGAGFAFYLEHGFKRVEVRGLSGALTSGQEAGTENILMAGSTSRCALTVQNAAYGLCSEGVNGVNSDVIMILHVDPVHQRLALLSIPRDLFLPNARSDGANKVDAALYEGLSQLVKVIEEDFGISIQHAVSLNFDQFANVVDALGGLNMSFPISVYDAESGLDIQAGTCVHLDGTEALAVVRARHLQYDASGSGPYAAYWPQEAQSDLARIRRDHEFLRVLAAAVSKRGLGNPFNDASLINSVKSDLTFDQSWSVSDMAHLLLDFHSVNINSVPQLTLPVSVVFDPDGGGGNLIYQGGNYGDVEFPAAAADRAAIARVLGVKSGVDTLTGRPLPRPSSVTVSVMNATGVGQQAATTADSLTALGFKTVGTGDVTPAGDLAETYVYYGSRAPDAEAAAEEVADNLTGAVVMGYAPSQMADGAKVTVVTGTQFAVSAPAPSATSTASAGGSSPGSNSSSSTSTVPGSTTTTTNPAALNITAPSAATSHLQPWDPRACPTGATPATPVRNRINP